MGVVCGLLGLSGTEYRAPILERFFRYPAERLVPFNLTMSLMTLGGALVGRETSVPASKLSPYWVELLALVVGIFVGALGVGRFSDANVLARVERWTLGVLVVVGMALVSVATLPTHAAGLPFGPLVRAPVGVCLGIFIGAVASVRGISGGELIVPALVLAFGVDIKLAGSASACASFPIVLFGLVRHARTHRFEPRREYQEIVVPMGVSSALGAITGGYLLERVGAFWLMIGFSALLIFSAVRGFQREAEK